MGNNLYLIFLDEEYFDLTFNSQRMQRSGWGMGAYHVMGQAEATGEICYP